VIYTSTETATGTKKCEFFSKTVISKSISAYVVLICCKKHSRTPWWWCRKTPKRVGGKKWL